MKIKAYKISELTPIWECGLFEVAFDCKLSEKRRYQLFCSIWEEVGDEQMKEWLKSEGWIMKKAKGAR